MIQEQIDLAIKMKNENLLKFLLSDKKNNLSPYELDHLQANLIKNNLFDTFSNLINNGNKIINIKNLIAIIMQINTTEMNKFLDFIFLKEDVRKALQDQKIFKNISAFNISLLEGDVNKLIPLQLLKKLENDNQLLGQALSESIKSICEKSPNVVMKKAPCIINKTIEAKYLLQEIFNRWDDKINFKVLKEAILITLKLKNFELTDLLLAQRKESVEFVEEEVYMIKKNTPNSPSHFWDQDHLIYFNKLGIDLTKKNLVLILNSTIGKLEAKDFFHSYMLTQPIEKLKDLVNLIEKQHIYMPQYLKEKDIYISLLKTYEFNLDLNSKLVEKEDGKEKNKKIKI